MSNKKPSSSRKRPYRLRERARRHDEVHKRITLAAVYLHGTIGPARTTMGSIAKHAGVRRATVYNHFPTDFDLIDACSSHWFGENPPPDPLPWKEIADPVRRTETALRAMYDYFERGQEMLGHVLRDAPLVPSLQEILRLKWGPLIDGIVGLLTVSWGSSEVTESPEAKPETDAVAHDQHRILSASLRVALDFFTWETLAGAGLSNERAALLTTAWVAAGAQALRSDQSRREN